MGFGDKGSGFRFEQRVTMPSTPGALHTPLTGREKEGREGGSRWRKRLGERGRWRERMRERWGERQRVCEIERQKQRERERAIARESERVSTWPHSMTLVEVAASSRVFRSRGKVTSNDFYCVDMLCVQYKSVNFGV